MAWQLGRPQARAVAAHAARARRLEQFSERLRRYYPEKVYGGEDGAIPPEILAAVKEAGASKRRKVESPFLDKNATPEDAATAVEEVKAKYEAKGATNVQLVPKVGGKGLGVHICEYAWAQDRDCVVVGSDGMTAFRNGTYTLGSVSDYVVKHSKCATVVTEVLKGN